MISDVRESLSDAIGAEVSEEQMNRILEIVPLSSTPGEHIQRDTFIIIGALAERMLCYGNLVLLQFIFNVFFLIKIDMFNTKKFTIVFKLN